MASELTLAWFIQNAGFFCHFLKAPYIVALEVFSCPLVISPNT